MWFWGRGTSFLKSEWQLLPSGDPGGPICLSPPEALSEIVGSVTKTDSRPAGRGRSCDALGCLLTHSETCAVNSRLCRASCPLPCIAKLGGGSHKLWILCSFHQVVKGPMWTASDTALHQLQKTLELYSKTDPSRQVLNSAETNSTLLIFTIFITFSFS